jgi:hypothetical protein
MIDGGKFYKYVSAPALAYRDRMFLFLSRDVPAAVLSWLFAYVGNFESFECICLHWTLFVGAITRSLGVFSQNACCQMELNGTDVIGTCAQLPSLQRKSKNSVYFVLQVKDLGEGNFGICQLMLDRTDREHVAVKFLPRGSKVRRSPHEFIVTSVVKSSSNRHLYACLSTMLVCAP